MGDEAAWKEAFAMFDLENEGSIPAKDLGLCLRYCGAIVSNAEVAKLAGDASVIKWDAVKKHVAELLKKNPIAGMDAKIKDHFKVFDKDEDGFVSTAEINYIMGKVAEKLSGEELEILNNEAQQYSDAGKIKYREFVDQMMTNVK